MTTKEWILKLASSKNFYDRNRAIHFSYFYPDLEETVYLRTKAMEFLGAL
jgi:hypothetical protein